MDTHGEITIKHGTIAVLDGQVITTDPEPGGEAAIIVPGEHVQIFVNGQLIKNAQEVKSSDKITVLPRNIKATWEIESRISSDGMYAYARFLQCNGENYRISDEAASQQLVINGVLAELTRPQIVISEVIQILNACKIVSGIMPELIQLAIDSLSSEEFVVAKGVAPQPGVDGFVKCLFQQKDQPKENEEVPLIHTHQVISVEAGERLVEVIPPVPGKTGVNVSGNLVQPPPVKSVKLIAGSGVELNKEGTSAFALISGRPVLKKNVIAVYPSYTLMGDIDAKTTGQINFKGDVVIKGNVLDGMKVEASGKVTVFGYVANSTIIAGGDIVIQNNLVGGIVRAGGVAAICQRLTSNLTSFVQKLKLLVPAVSQLKKHPSVARNRDLARLGDGVLIKMLLDTKFASLLSLCTDITEDLDQLVVFFESPKLENFRNSFSESNKEICAHVPLELNTIAKITAFVNKFVAEINTIKAIIQSRSEEKAKLSVLYVQNSVVESSGDVDVTGKGCYNSNIYAGGNVNIYGSPGVFRSGEIICGGNVKVRELGSVAEAITSIELHKDKLLKAEKVYPGVTVKIGVRVEHFTSVAHNLTLSGQ